MKTDVIRMYKALSASGAVYSQAQVRRFGRKLGKAKTPEHAAASLARQAFFQQNRALIRNDARVTHLAHMFLKGTDWARAEDPKLTHSVPKFDALVERVQEFAPERDIRDVTQSLGSWFDTWKNIRGR